MLKAFESYAPWANARAAKTLGAARARRNGPGSAYTFRRLRVSSAGGPASLVGSCLSGLRNNTTVNARVPPPTRSDTTTCQNSEVMSPDWMSQNMIPTVIASQPTTSHGPTRPNSRSRRCSRMKPTGITSRVRSDDVTRPPMTTVANGGQISFSLPVDIASGHRAAIVVAVVISTGRVRSRTEAKAAAPAVQPPMRTFCCILSTSRMAGLTVRPNSAIAPSAAIGLKDMPARTSAQLAPMTVSGTANSTSTGNVSDSKVRASTRNRSSTTGTRTRWSQLICSSCDDTSTVNPRGLGTARTDSAICSSIASRPDPLSGTPSPRRKKTRVSRRPFLCSIVGRAGICLMSARAAKGTTPAAVCSRKLRSSRPA